MADWEGDFGNEYTVRNMYVPDRGVFFRRFLKYSIGTVFEIGCNWGPNLQAFESIGIEALGCDVNEGAVKIANSMGLKAYHGGSEMCNEKFDFVFTVGVLIHQRTPAVVRMMREMVRLSSKYVMFAEYEGTDEEVPYRGERYALFKREFGKIFEAMYPAAILVDTGVAGKELGFDNVTYWMYDISDCASEIRFTPATGKSIKDGAEQEFVVTSLGTFREVGVN